MKQRTPLGKRNKLIALYLVLALIASVTVVATVFAEAIVNEPLHAWDDATNAWTNGNARYDLDGSPQAFYQRLNFDGTEIAACDTSLPGVVDAMTPWAGEIRIDHDSEYRNDAEGFQSTLEWKAVKCIPDETPTAAQILVDPCTPIGSNPNPSQFLGCEIVSQDQEVAVGSNGDKEIQSSVRGNLDQDCNNVIDANEDADPTNDIDPANICFYWQAQGLTPADASIGGGWPASQLQSSITVGGGEKTVQTKFAGVNAVTLMGIAAQPTPFGLKLASTLILLIGFAALLIVGYTVRRRIVNDPS